jgi:TonB family protein
MALISRRSLFWLAVPALLSSVTFSFAQTSQDSAPSRRVVERSVPVTPELARRMGIAGVVRIEAVVSPDGSVKAVEVKGGHPVLAQAAMNAVRKWKWEPAPHETRQMVELKFERVQ